MDDKARGEKIGVSAGNAMVLGAALGTVFVPLLGPISVVLGAGTGLLVGAATPLMFPN